MFNPVDRKEGMAAWRKHEAVIEARKGTRRPGHRSIMPAISWIASARGKSCNCDIETGHRDTTAALIGNISLKTESHLKWDAQTEKFTNNDAANQLLDYEYRARISWRDGDGKPESGIVSSSSQPRRGASR